MIISKKKSKLRNIFENVFFVTEMKMIFKWFLPIIIIVFAHNLYAQNIYYTDDYVANTEATDNVISTKNDAVLITVGENYTPPFLVSFFSGKEKISTVEIKTADRVGNYCHITDEQIEEVSVFLSNSNVVIGGNTNFSFRIALSTPQITHTILHAKYNNENIKSL